MLGWLLKCSKRIGYSVWTGAVVITGKPFTSSCAIDLVIFVGVTPINEMKMGFG